jgi:hypothetical protein
MAKEYLLNHFRWFNLEHKNTERKETSSAREQRWTAGHIMLEWRNFLARPEGFEPQTPDPYLR